MSTSTSSSGSPWQLARMRARPGVTTLPMLLRLHNKVPIQAHY